MELPDDLANLLVEFNSGSRDRLDEVFALVYDELRELARRNRRQWLGPAPAGTNTLIHETYLHLVDRTGAYFRDRSHFFYFASVVMRRVLIDSARRQHRLKRGGDVEFAPLDDMPAVSPETSEELLALDSALCRLSAMEPRLSRIVECRFFGGLTIEETAEALTLAPVTVRRGWTSARAWLYKELNGREL